MDDGGMLNGKAEVAETEVEVEMSDKYQVWSEGSAAVARRRRRRQESPGQLRDDLHFRRR
jgi:hypothetical protein